MYTILFPLSDLGSQVFCWGLWYIWCWVLCKDKGMSPVSFFIYSHSIRAAPFVDNVEFSLIWYTNGFFVKNQVECWAVDLHVGPQFYSIAQCFYFYVSTTVCSITLFRVMVPPVVSYCCPRLFWLPWVFWVTIWT